MRKSLEKMLDEIKAQLVGTKVVKVAIGKDKKPKDKQGELIFHIDI